MVTSTSRLAYGDCFDLLEQAINDQKGIQIKFGSYDDAFNFRLPLALGSSDRSYREQATLPRRSSYAWSIGL